VSARDELFAVLRLSGEDRAEAERLIANRDAEVLRERVACIRRDADLREIEGLNVEAAYGRELADLIDPDKETPSA
jgi:hypothetical protein